MFSKLFKIITLKTLTIYYFDFKMIKPGCFVGVYNHRTIKRTLCYQLSAILLLTLDEFEGKQNKHNIIYFIFWLWLFRTRSRGQRYLSWLRVHFCTLVSNIYQCPIAPNQVFLFFCVSIIFYLKQFSIYSSYSVFC